MKPNSTTKVTNGQKNTRKIGNKNTSLGVSQFYIIAYIYIIIWIWRSKWGTNEPTNALSSLNHLLEGAVYRPSVPLLVGCIILSPGCPGTHKIHKKNHALKQHSFYFKKKKRKPIKLKVYHKHNLQYLTIRVSPGDPNRQLTAFKISVNFNNCGAIPNSWMVNRC